MTEPAVSGPEAPGKPRRKRADGAVVSGILTYALVLVAALVPVPYLIQMPGPVVNTLAPVEGEDLITITGTETYEAEGRLDLLTVAVAGDTRRQNAEGFSVSLSTLPAGAQLTQSAAYGTIVNDDW